MNSYSTIQMLVVGGNIDLYLWTILANALLYQTQSNVTILIY